MAYGFTYTLPTITGSHSDAQLQLVCDGTRNDLPADAYNGPNAFSNGGGDLVAYTDSTKATRLPVHVVRFVTGATPDIEVRILMPSGNPMVTGATVYLEKDAVQVSQPAATATYGREAVYPSHTLASRLDTTSPENTANTSTGMTVNAVSVRTGPWGDALDFNGTSSDIDCGAALLPTGDFTQEAWVNPDDLVGFQGIVGNWVGGETGRTYVGLNGSGVNWDGYDTATNTNGTASALAWQKITVTRTGSAVNMYLGSSSIGSLTDSGTPNAAHNTFIGALEQGTNFFFDGGIAYVGLSNTGSSADRVATIYANESATSAWGTVGTWADSGGATYTLTADYAAYTTSAQAANLLHNKALTASVATFTTAGQDAGLYYNRVLTADSASYTTSANDAGLLFNRRLQAGSATYVTVANDVTLTYTPGASPTYTLTADTAVYSTAEQNAGLLHNKVMVAGLASYTTSAQQVIFRYSADLWAIESPVITSWSVQLKDSTSWVEAIKANTTWTIK